MTTKRYPLAPGLKWTGHLEVTRINVSSVDVAFDATDPKASESERYVYDRATLSFAMFKIWTGVDLNAGK